MRVASGRAINFERLAHIMGGGTAVRMRKPRLSLEQLYLRTVQGQADLTPKNPPAK